MPGSRLRQRLASVLAAYTHATDESDLSQAGAIGSRLAELGIGLEELVAMHLAKMEAVLADLPQRHVREAVIKSGNFLRAAAAGYSQAYHELVLLERRRREQARREQERIAAQEDEQRAVLDSIPEGCVLLDQSGRVRLMNRAARRLLQVPAREVMGHRLRPDAFPFSNAAVIQALQQLEQLEGRPIESEESEDGRTWHVAVVPVRAAREGFLGVLMMIHDVTRLRERERANSDFVELAVHEIRGPLGVALGYAEMMLARDLDPKVLHECAEMIFVETSRLTTLVANFLEIHRLRHGKGALRLAPIPLGPLCSTIVEQFQAATPTHQFSLSIPTDLPSVLADAERLTQVLRNLLTNAVTYSPRGGHIRLTARSSGREVIISVTDDGLGLPPEALPRLFESFYRVTSDDRRGIRGTGLGLALCRAIIEALGGRIWAESAGPGLGSTFSFSLPVCQGGDEIRDAIAALWADPDVRGENSRWRRTRPAVDREP